MQVPSEVFVVICTRGPYLTLDQAKAYEYARFHRGQVVPYVPVPPKENHDDNPQPVASPP